MGPGGFLLYRHCAGVGIAALPGTVCPFSGAVRIGHCLQAPDVGVCSPVPVFYPETEKVVETGTGHSFGGGHRAAGGLALHPGIQLPVAAPAL